MAARTIYDAVDAAGAPSPTATTPPNVAEPGSATQGRIAAQAGVRSTVQQAVRTAGRVQGSAQAARQSVLAPVKRASRAVSLEIAGSFYALFALSFSAAAWRFRDAAQGGDGRRLWAYVLLAVLFGYFALSSFLRARRISRG